MVLSTIVSMAILIVLVFRFSGKDESEDTRIEFNKWHKDNMDDYGE